MSYYIDIQHASKDTIPLSDERLSQCAKLPLAEHKESAELTLRLVDAEEMTQLNYDYRKQNKVTNVLAFPSDVPEIVELDFHFLGDVIICPEVLAKESQELGKSLEAHWAHIIIHGVLHLLGYDHIKEEDAEIMQALETKLLAKLGISSPYIKEDNHLE